jgi:acetylornithine deacetylase/succinyl-diaminopimelate desuccinylase
VSENLDRGSPPADVQDAIREADPIRLLRDLVRAPSHPGVARQEEPVARLLAAFLDRRGLEVSLDEVRPGRPNLIARLRGGGSGRALVLCGHTDTVPPNTVMTIDPFAAEIRDGRVYGRGACDMKGALAAMAAALAGLSDSRTRPAGDVLLAAVVDEEMGSLGAEALVRSGFRADGCVVGEPTGNEVAIGHRGVDWIEVELTGRAAHGGRPADGVSAILAAARLVRLLDEELRPALGRRAHPLMGAPSLNVGVIHGGDQPNIVPARCVVRIDRRWVPGETVEGIYAEVAGLVEEVRREAPGLLSEIRRAEGCLATMPHSPLDTPAGHPLVECALAVRRDHGAREPKPVAFPAWSDAALLANEAGIPAIVMGPGDLAQAHSADEWVSAAQVEEAAIQYAAVAARFCA